MKIFNIENGQEKVYVQVSDIAQLMRCREIPTSILNRFFINGFYYNDSNKNEFEEFSNKNEIEYFKKLDFIMDYRIVKDLSDEDLDFLINNESIGMANLKRKYSLEKDNSEKDILFEKIKLSLYKIDLLRYYKLFRQSGQKLSLPVVSDYQSVDLCNKDMIFQAYFSLDPNAIIITRRDGKSIQKDTLLDLLIENIKENYFPNNDYDIMMIDNKCILTFKINDLGYNSKNNLGIIRLVKSIFSKKERK